jgi:hypothetical protein
MLYSLLYRTHLAPSIIGRCLTLIPIVRVGFDFHTHRLKAGVEELRRCTVPCIAEVRALGTVVIHDIHEKPIFWTIRFSALHRISI